jgi:methylenetetrahydrofolate dehydrogenase (NADP+)/methenyltetrahydrofolate cyclohydrolase
MIINGKELAEKISTSLKERIARLSVQPVLCDIVIGDDPVTEKYVAAKQRAAEKLGLKFMEVSIPVTVSTAEVVAKINEVQESVVGLAGLIVQLPLPDHMDTQAILDAVKPELDIDCLSMVNTEALYAGNPRIVPPTAAAILEIIDSLPIVHEQQSYLVVGQGALVGKPVSALLRARGFKVVISDSQTEDLTELTKKAGVIICGVGKSGIITGDMINEGVSIIDAGTSESGGTVSGDVDFASVEPKSKFITPVPGGVGPVTVAKLLENVVASAEANP